MFDCVIINPPYDNQTHMRFLQSAIEHSARFVVSIQPCAWLFSKNNKVIGGEATREVIKTVEEHGAVIKLVKGMGIFDAALTQDISINVIDKTKSGSIDIDFGDFRGKHSFKRVSEVTKFLMIPEAKSLVDKINKMREDKGYSLSLWDVMKGEFYASLGKQAKSDLYKPHGKEWIVPIPGIRGHKNVKTGDLSEDFYTIVPREREPLRWSSFSVKPPYFFAFKRKSDATAFLKYLKSRIVRFLLACDKINMNLLRGELSRIPYPHPGSWYNGSFTNIDHLDDKALCEKLSVTEEEWKVVERVIPNYYRSRFKYGQKRQKK
jgi:hypothetical protein